MSGTFRRLTLVACLMGLFPAALRAEMSKALLEAIPGDARGFVIISNLDQFEAKVGKMGKALGAPVPPLVAQAQAMLGIQEGLDTKGAVALVMLDVKKFGQKGAVILLPTTSGDKVLDALKKGAPPAADEEGAEGEDAGKDEEADGADGVFRVGLMRQPAFAAKRGDYVVVGQSREACAAAAKSKGGLGAKIEKARMAAYDKSDLVLSIAASTLMDEFGDQIKGIMQMMAMSAGPQGAAGMAQMDQFIKMMGEVNAADLCLQLSDAGVKIVGLATPKGKSDLAGKLNKVKQSEKSLLTPLSRERFIFTMGSTGEQASEKEISEALNGMVASLNAKEKIDEKKLKTLTSDLAAFNALCSGVSMAISTLPEGPDGIVGACFVIEVSDSQTAVEKLGKIFATIKTISEDEEIKPVLDAIVHKPGAEEIEGSHVDHLMLDIAKVAEEMEPEDAESMKKVLGKDGLAFRFGPAGKTRLVMTLGGGKSHFARAAQAAKSGAGGLSDDKGILASSKQLPASKNGEFFISVDSAMEAVGRIMTAVGEEEEMPFKLSKELNAPIAGSTSVDDGSARFDLFVPMELVVAIKDGVMAAQAAEDEDEEDADAPAGQHGEKGDKDEKGDKPDKSEDEE